MTSAIAAPPGGPYHHAVFDLGCNMTIAAAVRDYIRENFIFGNAGALGDQDSLLDAGVIDSTGAMEIVTFLETKFGIAIDDRDLVPENLDSVSAIATFVTRKLADAQASAGAASTVPS